MMTEQVEPAEKAARVRIPGWLGHPFRHWPLRRKLVVAVVAIVAVMGAFVGALSIALLDGYLIERVDVQLATASQTSLQAAVGYVENGQTPTLRAIVGAPGQPSGIVVGLIEGGQWSGGAYLPSGPAPSGQPFNTQSTIDTASTAALATLPANGVPSTVTISIIESNGWDVGGAYRAVAQRLTDDDTLIVALPLREAQATTARLTVITLLVVIGAGILAAAAGLVIIRLALRPLERVAATATQVSRLPLERGDVALGIRVPDEDTDPRTEVGRVGSAFNAMLGHVAGALQVRQASEAKVRQFVSDASHELRTPLASIRGYSELARRSPEELSEDLARSISRIESEAKRMTTIVEDLLMLARLDEGQELRHENVDLTMMLINAVSDAHAAGPDHEWKLELPEDEPVEIIGDGAKLHQAVANLLANARVHTPAGTVVTSSLRQDGDHAVIVVADDGPGIPEELRPRLFERFARGDSSRSRATGSTGLGLAIAKAVVDAHGGEISVETAPGVTAFTISVPVAPGDLADAVGPRTL
ncbi:HAMP domain-containing sensor histidine kinase [Gryllotalpicola sp.]|uniref:sensor histidine kinase n=1 Tax=Gryllotalpicola sp. TaxID=1932787 RepID=UPI002625FCA0|nr:HAMP domain-containing sensor histidine kinase [Gryllotalpicola sp.]